MYHTDKEMMCTSTGMIGLYRLDSNSAVALLCVVCIMYEMSPISMLTPAIE